MPLNTHTLYNVHFVDIVISEKGRRRLPKDTNRTYSLTRLSDNALAGVVLGKRAEPHLPASCRAGGMRRGGSNGTATLLTGVDALAAAQAPPADNSSDRVLASWLGASENDVN